MVLFRFVAWLAFLVAAIDLVNDATHAMTAGSPLLVSTLSYWKTTAPATLASTAVALKTLHPKLWDPVAVHLLLLPAWAVFGALGLTLAVLGRRKRRINIFAN